MLNNARMERINEDMELPEQAVLDLLKAAMGGDDSPPWPANQRWLLWNADELIGHVAAQRRWFVVNRRYFEGWHVGGVCIRPEVQRQGVGTRLMEQVHADLAQQELTFAVLNCGPALASFYGGVGYVKVADHGLYLRAGKLAQEADPAMAISFSEAFEVSVLSCEAFPFGFDF